MIELTLYTRNDCELCHEMEQVLSTELRRFDARLTRIEIDGNPALEQLYGTEIPVLLVNDRKAFKYRCKPREMRKRLLRQVRRCCHQKSHRPPGWYWSRFLVKSRARQSPRPWSAIDWPLASISSVRCDQSIDGRKSSKMIASSFCWRKPEPACSSVSNAACGNSIA